MKLVERAGGGAGLGIIGLFVHGVEPGGERLEVGGGEGRADEGFDLGGGHAEFDLAEGAVGVGGGVFGIEGEEGEGEEEEGEGGKGEGDLAEVEEEGGEGGALAVVEGWEEVEGEEEGGGGEEEALAEGGGDGVLEAEEEEGEGEEEAEGVAGEGVG